MADPLTRRRRRLSRAAAEAPVGTVAGMRRVVRAAGLRGLFFASAVLFLHVASSVAAAAHAGGGGGGDGLDTSGLVVSEQRAAHLGFSRTVWGGPKGDMVVEFYHSNGTDTCNSYILVPAENIWSKPVRGLLYLVTMFYIFIGIAIASDVFMSSIERITAARTEIKIKEDGSQYIITVVVWNETVANLTLMALGSSAPEILISLVETVSTIDSEPGELGPSTIVGSAAFNLFVITGICMLIEKPKKIKELGVFVITSMSSLFAYFWMIVVLVFWTEDEVTIIEGVLTLLFFPALVIIAYLQDRGWCRSVEDVHVEQKIISASVHQGQLDRENIQELWRKMKEEGAHTDTTEFETLDLLMKAKELQKSGSQSAHWSRAAYRMNAVRSMSKKPCFIERRSSEATLKRHPTSEDADGTIHVRGSSSSLRHTKDSREENSSDGGTDAAHSIQMQTRAPAHTDGGVIEWSSPTYSVVENEKKVSLSILRRGCTDETVTVKYATVPGTAAAGLKYEEQSGVIVFEAGQERKEVTIVIVDDKQYQEDQHFYVVLRQATNGAVLGDKAKAEVTIIDDDQPGDIGFLKPMVTLSESSVVALIPIIRRNGCDGRVSVTVQAVDETATNGRSYDFETQVIEMHHEETMATAALTLVDETSYAKNETLLLRLTATSGGARLGSLRECRVTITNDPVVSALIDQVLAHLSDEQASLEEKMVSSTWWAQFRDAMVIEVPDGQELSGGDLVLHFLTLFWKVLFATVPPTSLLGGWLTFVVSLLYIGIIVAIVGEVATLFGCVCSVPDPVTAITFVALGTSLPDLFASKTAIDEEDYADAAIGNVTGSNSVNVFLGLGLPWVFASIYKESKGENVKGGGALAYSVIVFICCAIVCLACLGFNRKVCGGELGGPYKRPLCVLLVMLWVVYLLTTIIRTST